MTCRFQFNERPEVSLSGDKKMKHYLNHINTHVFQQMLCNTLSIGLRLTCSDGKFR